MPTKTHKRVVSESRAKQIAAQLEAEIINGQRKPRERLVELDLAAQFGVSRAPVRDALGILERDHLVSRGKRGMEVADVALEDIKDTFDILACLERECTGRATPHLSAKDLEHLKKILDDMTVAAKNQEVHRYFELNMQFHDVIYRACPNRKLVDLLRGLGKPTLRYRHLAMSLPDRLAKSIGEHREILKSLRQRDATQAGHAAQRSAEEAAGTLMRFLMNNPRVF